MDDPTDVGRLQEELRPILRHLISMQRIVLDRLEDQLQADDRDEVNMALAGQCRRLKLILRQLEDGIGHDAIQAPSADIHLAVERSERAIAALMLSASTLPPPR